MYGDAAWDAVCDWDWEQACAKAAEVAPTLCAIATRCETRHLLARCYGIEPLPPDGDPRMNRNLAIVPAFNEAESIRPTVEAIHQWAPDFDVLVVDDGSTDATAELASSAGASVLRMPFNLGIGGAMQAGYIFALERGYEIAVQVDGDGQHDPRHVHNLLGRLREDPELNMVTGSRFLSSSGHGFQSSAARRAGIRIFSSIVSLITGQRVTDPTSGFRMTTRRGIELFAHDYPHDYPEVEAILLMHAHRLRSCEIPVQMRPRRTGESAISSTQSVYYMIKVLLAVFVGLFRRRPTVEAGERPAVAVEHSI
jgi:glycosyltransferase involved in cell wall biosynthesis